MISRDSDQWGAGWSEEGPFQADSICKNPTGLSYCGTGKWFKASKVHWDRCNKGGSIGSNRETVKTLTCHVEERELYGCVPGEEDCRHGSEMMKLRLGSSDF